MKQTYAFEEQTENEKGHGKINRTNCCNENTERLWFKIVSIENKTRW